MSALRVLKDTTALQLVAPQSRPHHVPAGWRRIRTADHRSYIVPAWACGRRRTNDLMTYDNRAYTTDDRGNVRGATFDSVYRLSDYERPTTDGRPSGQWVRGRTADSSGAFMNAELERLDLTLHMPLVSISYGRDIQLREDVTDADEVSSYTVSTFGAPGSLGTGQITPSGISWVGKESTAVARVSVDIAKLTAALTPWARELAYTIWELESAAKVGRPIDDQKWQAIKMKHQMDIDQMVYFGDTAKGFFGLVNSNNRTGSDAITAVANAPNGGQGLPQWSTKTPAEILADFNLAIITAWANAGFAVIPSHVLLPTTQYGFISTQLISSAGTVSILKYIRENNILAAAGMGPISIFPSKWCNGAGQGGTIGVPGIDRMVTYTNDKERVRYPMTMLKNTPVQYDGLWHKRTSYCKLGVLEIPYPETIDYLDNI